MNNVRILVLTGFGLNCDNETAYACELAGAKAFRVHINSLIDGTVLLDDFQIMVFVGGFSWGDDHGAGVIQAVRLKTDLGDKLKRFIDDEKLILGICNGFQTIVNMGLLPGFCNCSSFESVNKRSVALTYNDCGNFRDAWVTLKTNPESPCVFTRGLDKIELPVRHGEGKFYAEESTILRLIDNNQVVLRYALPDGGKADCRFPFNPNGSVEDIAGICDPSGRIFGLMPHPEAFNHITNHPDWTRIKEQRKRLGKVVSKEPPAGVRMFINAVNYFS